MNETDLINNILNVNDINKCENNITEKLIVHNLNKIWMILEERGFSCTINVNAFLVKNKLYNKLLYYSNEPKTTETKGLPGAIPEIKLHNYRNPLNLININVYKLKNEPNYKKLNSNFWKLFFELIKNGYRINFVVKEKCKLYIKNLDEIIYLDYIEIIPYFLNNDFSNYITDGLNIPIILSIDT